MKGRKFVSTAATGVATLTIGAGIALAGGLGFDQPAPYDTDTRPIDIAIGKIDEGPAKDIAVANRDGTSVSVLIGAGDGTFEDAVTLDLPSQPSSVAIAKVDGDKRPDLVVSQGPTSEEPSGIAVLRGKANGFGQPKSYAVKDAAIKTTDVAVADLDRDGRSDVVVGQQQNGNDLYVLYGTKVGFAKPKAFTLADGGTEGFWVQDVAVADFDKDGVKDIAATAFQASGVFMLWGKGSKQSPKRRYADVRLPTPSLPNGLDAGKVNGDGRLDLVVASQEDGGVVSVLVSDGNRGFDDFATYDANGATESVAFGKFNGDSVLDIVGADFGNNQIEVLLGSIGGFAPSESFGLQADVIDVDAAQLDGQDGDDVVTALFNDGRINVVLSDFE